VSELSQDFNALLDEVRAVEHKLLSADPPLGEPDLLDGYRLAFSLLKVAVDAYVWGDKDKPIMVDVISPYLKWGGDNSDAFYQLAPLDPERTYRVTGNRGDAVYLSMTVYGGPGEGQYSNRIVGTINDRTLEFDPDGNFDFMLSPHAQPGAWLQLAPDVDFALTRDYLADPGHRPPAEVAHRGDRPAGPPCRQRRRPGPAVARGPNLAARAGVVPAHPARTGQSHPRAVPGAPTRLRLVGGRRLLRDGRL
jgi:Protein of unknown function (DUF1214)